LLFSIILKPKINHSSLPILTLLAARAVSDTIHKKLNVRTTLKRPNDVLIGGKKVAGILTESLGNSREMTYVVIGIGVNINAKPKELVKGATSVWAATGERTKVDALLEPILRIFFREYADLNGGNRKNLRKTVEQAASQY
jgi:BirA family transcriptional regulator, biotin operon repressor / biotin---[acetyl-CoA-carboxylase] ligase